MIPSRNLPPDRKSLGMASHFDAAKGAYLVREYQGDAAPMGTFYVQGTRAMANLIKGLPSLEKKQYNMKIVYVASPKLFALQDEAYRSSIVTDFDKEHSTRITASGKRLIPEFSFSKRSIQFAVSPDWDNRWRTGGTLDEILDEAHLSAQWIEAGIDAFVQEINKKILKKYNVYGGKNELY